MKTEKCTARNKGEGQYKNEKAEMYCPKQRIRAV